MSSDERISVNLYQTPPTDASGASATARCNDGSWSQATTRQDARTADRGVASRVCPGPLCATQ